MTEKTSFQSITTTLSALLLLIVGITTAGDWSLIQIERRSDADRNALIEAGVSLVAETNDALLAVGDTSMVTAAASARSLATEIIAGYPITGELALVGLRPGWTDSDLAVCGSVIASGDGWHLVEGERTTRGACLESPGWFIRPLDLEPIAPHREPPEEWAGLADGEATLVADPLVQEMVDRIDTAFALSHWSALSESTGWTTRHSASQGCVDAAAYVHTLFSSLGLATEYQHHTGGYADNVIGTLVGSVEPDKIYIAIGHLDDLPSSGPAPGADDNASGSAMVTALAEVMSDYCFVRTIKFLTVTGEEQGLYGSDHYADAAAALGEDIQAVLNGDMIGWEGDGQPADEDLDVNFNSGSQWLAQAMVAAAADYGTGIAVNAFLCPSMTYSDHAPFWSNGFSAICGITDNEGFCGEGGSYPYYHQSSDTIANCGTGAPDFEAAAIRTYIATLAHLAQPIALVPDTPLGIDAQPDGANRIALSWIPQGLGVDYRVYRAAGGCGNPGPATLVGETGLASFVDTTASGGVPYAYTVVAATADICTSPVSACVEATTTGSCTEPPTFSGADEVVNAAASNCRLTVQWQQPEHVWCGGPTAYNVYRSTTQGFTPSGANRVAWNIATTSFDDYDVISGDVFHYIVRAVDLAHGGEDSNTHEVSGAPTGPAVVGAWNDDAGDTGAAKMATTSPWAVVAGAGVSGAAYTTGAYDPNICVALTTPPLMLDADPQLEFWSKYEIEAGWDKGELQITTDGGSNWTRVAMAYPGSSNQTNDQCGLGAGTFFTGSASTYGTYSADLSAWAGEDEAALRWIFSSDGYSEDDGWWIDDISITDVAVPGSCFSAEQIFNDGFESGSTSAWSQ